MNSKKSGKAAAVIVVEPTFLRLKISQLKKGRIADIDDLEYPLRMGTEIDSEGRIGFESLRELSKAFRGYGKITQGYGIESCLTAAGPGILEAKNRAFLTDRLKALNGADPKEYEIGRENALVCYEIMSSAPPEPDAERVPTVTARIGSGHICLSAFANGPAVFSGIFPAGPLKLHELFSEIQDPADLACAAEEYLDDLFGGLRLPFPEGARPRLILSGHELGPAAALCGAAEENRQTDPARISDLFERIRSLTADRIGIRLDLPEETAKRLYFALAASRSLIRALSPGTAVLPETDLADALMRQTLLPKEQNGFRGHLREGALSCARAIACGCGCRREHIEFVRKLSCRIFDKVQKEYGLDRGKRLLLELAAILHDCAGAVRDGAIYGLTGEELATVLSIAGKDGESRSPEPRSGAELAVVRLSAIFDLAESLDRSGKQKFGDVRVKAEKNILRVLAESSEEAALEKWAFGGCASRFTEAFGLTPELTVRFADVPGENNHE